MLPSLLVDAAVNTFQFLERQETRATVRACINQLPNDYHTILVLRDREEQDTDETAAYNEHVNRVLY